MDPNAKTAMRVRHLELELASMKWSGNNKVGEG